MAVKKTGFRIIRPGLVPFDVQLIAITLLLCAAGIVTLWGATSGGEGVRLLEIPGYAKRQMIFCGLGIVAAGVAAVFDYRKLGRLSWGFYAALILALLGLLIRGQTTKGAASWYDLGPVRFQPSEPGKLVIILLLAHLLSRRISRFRGLMSTVLPLAVVGTPALLILLQRDLGTAVVLIPVAGSMFWVAGLRKRVFVLFMLLGVGAIVAAYPQLKPYQKERIETFLNPGDDLKGSGWNIYQAKVALGSGSILGKGWGRGTQTSFRYLPEYHTDFIFPTVGEQFGLVGCVVVLVLFMMLIWRLVALAIPSDDPFGLLILTGIAAMLVTHIVQNVGMVLGLLPITGLPLPFFSYGGSFMLTCMTAIGLALSIGARREL